MIDARLEELRFLTRLERDRVIDLSGREPKDPEVRIAIGLLAAGVVNDASTVSLNQHYYEVPPGGANLYKQYVEGEQWKIINALHQRGYARIDATHASACRRAELEQRIQTGRLKDPTGILFDGRYAERDVQMALWAASADEPLALAFLDMNGLKQINDTFGHEAGDDAVRSFFEVIADVAAEAGAAYRVGGDEVVLLLPNTRLGDGAKLVALILRGLSVRNTKGGGTPLSAVAGIVSAKDPNELPHAARARADKAQYRAKDASKANPAKRVGALAVEDVEEIETF